MTNDTHAAEFEKIDKAGIRRESNHPEIYNQLHEILKTYQGTAAGRAGLHWRLARSAFMYSLIKELNKCSEDEVRALAIEAKDMALISTREDPNSADAHMWAAITLGRIVGKFADSKKDKVQLALEIKKEVDAGLQIRPADPILHYINGRWLYSIADLSWIERKVAATFWGALPNATYDEAIEELKKVHEMKVKTKAIYYFLAKCYSRKKDYREAVKWLDIGLNTNGVSIEDEYYQEALVALKKKYETQGSKEDLLDTNAGW